ncbi:MCP four helix bundle domain-containing protein, partial [Novosphingobium sp.]|uniref:MCP four helix bundle domain-containing protein n=1 Tax=Novosphingobium sp. TaxID=1874826 RepID=UPI0028AFE802
MLDFLNNWRLPKKLWAAFSIINVMIAVVGLNGFLSTRELNAVAESHVSRGMAGMSGLTDVISNVKELRIIVYSYYNAASASDAQNLRDRLKAGDDELLKSVDAYKVIGEEAFGPEVAELRTRAVALTQVNDRIFALRTAGDVDAAMAMIKDEGKKASHDMIEQTDKLIELTRERVAAKAEDGAATARTATILCVTLALFAMALIVFIWLLINRTVAAPMSRIAHVTTTLAEGGKVEVPFRERGDEIGEIAEAVEQFRSAAEAR